MQLTEERPGSQRRPILVTKLAPPRVRGLIERPRLLAVASQLSSKLLTAIKAPAGFGKTSLAAGWADGLHQQGALVAWLSIDAEDDEPARFLFGVIQAVRRAAPALRMHATDSMAELVLINTHDIVSGLINDLADVDDDIYLFLDDYHLVVHPAIHDAVAFLLKRAPPVLHVIITTRTEPPLPIALLRGNNQLIEIDATGLRFSEPETCEFLQMERQGNFELAEVALLHSRTEGWPAALRIAVSTLGHESARYDPDLSGAELPLDAYLTEMLHSLPEDIVLFMLRTSILDRLSPPLCSSVTGVVASQAFLAFIEKRQLLLSALDQDGQWYRYHSLMAEYLKKRLASGYCTEVAELHNRAARWYASQELWTEAVQHAIAGGDTDQAQSWINRGVMQLVRKGDLLTLLAWQRLFPSSLIKRDPSIGLAIAWGLSLANRVDEALKMLDEIENDHAIPDDSGHDFLTECQTIRAVALSLADQGRVALPLAKLCVARSTDPWTANVASNVVRFWHYRTGDLKEFYATPWIPYSSDEDRRNVFAAVYRRCIQGNAESRQLRLDVAEHFYTDALRLAAVSTGQNSIAAALPASLLARIRYEQGRTDEAEAMLFDRLPFIDAGAMLDCVLSAYFTMVRTASIRGNFQRAHTLLERAERLGMERDWGRLRAVAALERVWLHVKENRIGEGAADCERLLSFVDKYPASVDFAWSDIERYSSLAQAYLASAEQRIGDAISLLKRLKNDADLVQDRYFALRVSVHLATVLFTANRTADALGELRRVLGIAMQAGIHQTIVDEGPAMANLLAAFQENTRRTGKSAELVSYVGALMASCRARYECGSQSTLTPTLSNPLSAREGTILNLIAEGRSNKEIARDLAVAPETVKSHVKHIFTKLGTERRAQAVARAQSLGLVATR